jgi:hypothetical protein
MPTLKWFLIYKVTELTGVAASVVFFFALSDGRVPPLHLAGWALGIGLIVVVTDEVIGGLTPSTPDD